MFTGLILFSSLARADVLVPGQEICDGKKQCGKLEIVSCQASYHGEPTPDCEPYKTDAYRFACEGGGATVSTAYYCKLDGAKAPAPPTEPTAQPTPADPTPAAEAPKADAEKRCATTPQGGFAAMGVAWLLLAWRRR